MGRMAETVLKKSNAAEKEVERRVMAQALERERKAEADEKHKKEAARQRDLDVRATLEKQLQEKRDLKQKELAENRKFIDMVLARDEADRKEQKEKQQKTFAQMKELARFQKIQMGEYAQEPSAKIDESQLRGGSVAQSVAGTNM